LQNGGDCTYMAKRVIEICNENGVKWVGK